MNDVERELIEKSERLRRKKSELAEAVSQSQSLISKFKRGSKAKQRAIETRDDFLRQLNMVKDWLKNTQARLNASNDSDIAYGRIFMSEAKASLSEHAYKTLHERAQARFNELSGVEGEPCT